jgi:hypothetical protein
LAWPQVPKNPLKNWPPHLRSPLQGDVGTWDCCLGRATGDWGWGVPQCHTGHWGLGPGAWGRGSLGPIAPLPTRRCFQPKQGKQETRPRKSPGRAARAAKFKCTYRFAVCGCHQQVLVSTRCKYKYIIHTNCQLPARHPPPAMCVVRRAICPKTADTLVACIDFEITWIRPKPAPQFCTRRCCVS